VELKLSKSRTVLYLAALFLTNVAFMADQVLVPALSDIYDAFPGQVNLVNFVSSGPALIAIFSSLFCAKLMQHQSKKTILVWVYGLFTVASIAGVAVVNIYYMMAMRAIVGFCYGITNVAAIAMLAQSYDDDKSRSTMIGVYNAFMAIIGALMGLAAGYFAAISWKSVFLVYWISVPIWILIVLFVPKTPVDKPRNEEEAAASAKEKINPRTMIPLCLSFLVINSIYCVVFYQVSLYVTQQNIGGPSVTGVLSAVGTVGSAVAGLMFGLTNRWLKRGAIIPSYALLAACYMILLVAPNLPATITSCTVMGFAFGNSYSYFYNRYTIIVPPSKIPLSMSIYSAVNGVGMFIATYLSTGLEYILHVNTLIGVIPVFITVMAVGCVLSVIMTIREKKHPSAYDPNANAR